MTLNLNVWQRAKAEDKKKHDPINHPKHYTQGRFEVIEIIKDQLTREEYQGYLKGNILKYMCRYRHKKSQNGTQDLEKAKVFLEWLIEAMRNAKNHKNP